MKEVRVSLKLPREVSASDETLQRARRAALESLVVALWEGEHLSTREAAKRLGLTYYDFTELLGARGVPVVRHTADEQTLEAIQKKLKLHPHQ